MKRLWMLLVVATTVLALSAARNKPSGPENPANAPTYTPDGSLKFPEHYREWIYLTSGLDMSYRQMGGMDHSMFDNIFVNPEAYKAFVETGNWPDKTMLVLEARKAGSKASINKNGHFQSGEVMGLEVHVKDKGRYEGGWAFFDADNGVTGKLLPKEMDCYSCHTQHGAVDTTFVQFYPTLLEIAKKKNTLSAAYVKEESAK